MHGWDWGDRQLKRQTTCRGDSEGCIFACARLGGLGGQEGRMK